MTGKRMVLLEFSGKELTNGKVFDTTSEKEARENGLYSENAVFAPVPVVVGNKDILPSLDEEVAGMKEGEERIVKLPPEKAFGERKKELVVVVPLQAFHSRKINPVPGLVVDLNGAMGKVQTVSGGRVRVDMNSELAGKEVEYRLKVVKEIVDDKEKVQALAEKFFPLRQKPETRLEGGVLKVKLPKEIAQQLAQLVPSFTKTVKEVVPEIKEVVAADSFEEKKEVAREIHEAGKDKKTVVEGVTIEAEKMWQQDNVGQTETRTQQEKIESAAPVIQTPSSTTEAPAKKEAASTAKRKLKRGKKPQTKKAKWIM